MLKKLTFALSGIVAITSYAQNNYIWGLNSWQYFNYHHSTVTGTGITDSFALENKIYQVSKNSTYIEGKRHEYYDHIITFDRMGRSIIQMGSSDTGSGKRITWLRQRNFNGSGLMDQNIYNPGNRYAYSQFFEFNDSGKVITGTYFDSKNRFSGKTQVTYNEKGKQSNVVQRGKKNKVLHSYTYYYYPDGQIKQTVLSGRKGKIIRVTDYSCDETGKTTKKMKDTARVCSVKSYLPDGSIITTTQSFNYRGVPYKTVEIRNAANLLLEYDLYIGIKEELHYTNLYTYNGAARVKYEFKDFSKKRHFYSETTEYDMKGRIIKNESVKMVSRSGKETWRREYEYNEKGMIMQEKAYKNGTLKSEALFRYTYYK
jgi:hypothetical protein